MRSHCRQRYLPAFRTNVFDFDAAPTCWSGSAFDFIHYHIPRSDLDDIAEDWEFGPIGDYKQSVIEDDLVLAQLTEEPFAIDCEETTSLPPWFLDHFQLVLGAHLLQRYGGISRIDAPAVGRTCCLAEEAGCRAPSRESGWKPPARQSRKRVRAFCQAAISRVLLRLLSAFRGHQWLDSPADRSR